MAQEAVRAWALAGQTFEFAMVSEYSEEALQAFDRAPDVVLAASFLRQPESFAAVVKTIQAAFPGTPVVAVCPFHTREEVLGTIALGVAGCVSAEAGFDKVAEAILTVQHRAYLCSRVSALLREAPQRVIGEKLLGEGHVLTPREAQIVRMIADGNTDREIAKIHGLSVRTVNSHRANIMAKLRVHNVIQLIRRATQLGLLDGGT
jgi:DNA-binding NarL/FixJ family response regulator